MRKPSFLRIALASFACCAIATVAIAAPPPLTAEERAYYDGLKRASNDEIRAQLKAPQDVVDGQTLHPKLQSHLERSGRGKAAAPYAEQLAKPGAVEAIRASVDRAWGHRSAPSKEMKKVEDRKIPGPAGDVEIRVYTPDVQPAPNEKLPILVYLHGGGWLFGSIEAVDPAVRLIANEAKVIVVSANYRLTPENKFPAAQDDALAAFRWVRDHAAELGGDAKRVGIGGDSAGGQMSVVTSLRLAAAGEQGPVYQLLYYPVVDTNVEKYRSAQLFGTGFGLDLEFGNFILASYFSDVASRTKPDASPILAPSFKGMPPAIIATAGFDMLRDQGRVLADRMKEEGIPATYRNYPSLIHGFLQHSYTTDDAETACVETARMFGDAIRKVNLR